jgi:hypothetical protein
LKHAYVSLVLLDRANKLSELEVSRLDLLFSHEARNHEIIVVRNSRFNEGEYRSVILKGPLTFIFTKSSATRSDSIIAGLGRSVGDFILEWNVDSKNLNSEVISKLFALTNVGNELIEALPRKLSLTTRTFLRLTNMLRPNDQPLRKTLAHLYSRRSLNWVLEANRYESHIAVLVAETPFQKTTHVLPFISDEKRSLAVRLHEGLILLTKGSRLGTVLPLFLAGVSSITAVVIAIYAIFVYLMEKTILEGWASLAITIGFGQGAILALIGMVWNRLDQLAKGLSSRNDVTADVEVIPSRL